MSVGPPRVPSFVAHLRRTNCAADAVFCMKATCVPSGERTTEVTIAPVVPVLYAQYVWGLANEQNEERLSNAAMVACDADPARLVLYTTKSGCGAPTQLRVVASNENFAG